MLHGHGIEEKKFVIRATFIIFAP